MRRSLARLIADASGKQSCLDPVTAWLLKQHKTESSPFLTELFNSSFESGKVPLDMKTAIIVPRLKKVNLNQNYKTTDPCLIYLFCNAT